MLYIALIAALVAVVLGNSKWRVYEGVGLPEVSKPGLAPPSTRTSTLPPSDTRLASQSDSLQQHGPYLSDTGDQNDIFEVGNYIQHAQMSERELRDGVTSRDLKQISPQVGEITEVYTSAGLRQAIEEGAEYIEIHEHIDLMELDVKAGDRILGTVPPSVKSIRGNCNSEVQFGKVGKWNPDDAPMRELLPRQCLVVADHNVLKVLDSKLWIDQIYFRTASPARNGYFDQIILVEGTLAEVWMTTVTFQGNGDVQQDCIDCGVAALDQARIFIGDAIVADFDGFRTVYAGEGSKIALTRTHFTTNNLFADNFGAAVVEADGAGGTAIRMQLCSFEGKPPGDELPRLLADNRGATTQAVFYSDAASPPICTYAGGPQVNEPPPCANITPQSLDEAAGLFLSGRSQWLLDLHETLRALGTTAPIHTSNANSAPLPPGVEAIQTENAPAQVDEATNVFSWEYVWVAILVAAVLAGIGITAICLF